MEIKNEELKELKRLRDRGLSKKARQRAMALLLHCESGYKKVKIAKIMGVSQRSIFKWFKEYREDAINSLDSKPRGDNSILNQGHKAIIKKHIEGNPNRPKVAYCLSVEDIGKKFSYKTFSRFLKKYFI